MTSAIQRNPLIIIISGCLIAMVGFGIRSSLGLFLDPLTEFRGWSRESYGLAMAIQNLLWGIAVPIASALSDKFGPKYVMGAGALFYAIGLYGMAFSDSTGLFHLSGGIMVGLGIAFTAFSIAIASIAAAVPQEKRSLALGLGTAAGSFGQVVFSPIGQGFIELFGWQQALIWLGGICLLIIPLALILPKTDKTSVSELAQESLNESLKGAIQHRGYICLILGFFVCGFQVAFITVHFPAFLKDCGLSPSVSVIAISLIGIFNIFGSLASGWIGQRYSKKYSLSIIYFARTLLIAYFLMAPKNEANVYFFSAMMGVFWLSTVPLTTGIISVVFGVRYLATLFGLVFLSHQIGSFLGVWLGGYFYHVYGSYDMIWWFQIALGVWATLIHIPIHEKPASIRLKPA